MLGLTAGASLLAALPVRAEQPALHSITPAQVEGLCPGVTLPGTVLGAPRSAQDAGFVASLHKLPARFAPFAEAELDLTDWSDRLAAITWRGASPDGDVNTRTMEAFRAAMTAAGWAETVQGDLMTPLGFDAVMFEKDLPTNLGTRRMLVEFDTPGALMLRCGDAELLELALAERDGKLAPGSPRPSLPALGPAAALPDASVCADPAVQAVFVDEGRIDEANPALQRLLAAGEQSGAMSHAAKRLNTWLKWKLLGSGKIDADALWTVQERVEAHDGEALTQDMTGFLAAAGAMMQARKAGDRAQICRAFLDVMHFQHAREQREAAKWTRVNAALEAEAARLGIALD
ncbi:hypothetical protein [Novosphingobium sp.]|uniref:hypothetical protein n=1 Tax=Novosphingobium sp. TaxID=1874826 RepID=UPI00273586B3|nr:hypothetical protein [Novosphingobium sp.]MDP3907204.1 hypothetical protein [Novosphingobium sp.]